MWVVWVLYGCASSGAWTYQQGLTQSTTGSQPIVAIRARDAPRDLVITCAADGLQLSLGQREPATTVRIDDRPPETWPIRISARGVPVVDLRIPIGGSTTGEQRLVGARRLALLSGPDPGAAVVATFDVSDSERAIRRLRCPSP